ncbi:hypothetical protein, partial [Escherichia coli]|uniref:hypothetical protein n=1 Tax=Escherichia coli TaxID=562 RepID=UPI003AAA4C81
QRPHGSRPAGAWRSDSLAYQLPSPFPPKHQAILVTQYVQTTYHEREHNVPRIIASWHAMLTAKHGNYLVFFPVVWLSAADQNCL